MRYMLMICHGENFDPPGTVVADTDAWVEEMDARGVRELGRRLRPSSDATTVRMRDEEVLLSDGPFAEIKEQIAGFDLIECEDLDEAIGVAARHPMAKYGMIEIRPIWEGLWEA